jgi:hypothetical protein
MGLCLDFFTRISDMDYPVRMDFKFGGTGVALGEPVVVAMEKEPGLGPGAQVRIVKDGDKKPYLYGLFSKSKLDPSLSVPPFDPSSSFRRLPYYSNCFVCGRQRTEPGLERRFRYHHQSDRSETSVVWGGNEEDYHRSGNFLICADQLHPAVILSIFDENTGWAGFMKTSSAGLSIRISLDLLRPVSNNERLVFIGYPQGVRGNSRAPRFFKAAGAVLSIDDRHAVSTVAVGSGEWIIMEKYTTQLKENLFPRDDWNWVFPDKSGG